MPRQSRILAPPDDPCARQRHFAKEGAKDAGKDAAVDALKGKLGGFLKKKKP